MEKKTSLKQAVLISGFPGSGKTHAYNHYQDKFTMLDSDSSEFSWVKDENGVNTKTRNPDFPENYIKHIKDNIDKVDIIFVFTHKVVLDALKKEGLEYYLIYPYDDAIMRTMFMERYEMRGSDPEFIEMIKKNWANFMFDMESNLYGIHIRLGEEGVPTCITDGLLQELVDLSINRQE